MKCSGIVSRPCLTALGLTLVGLALFLNGELAAEPRTEPKSEARQGRYALLVGCTEYQNLGKFLWLNGPGNDVQLLRSVLVEKLAFPAANITTLSDEAARAQKDDKLYPTRANIKREIERLTTVAKAGDKVVILLAGHGSQQPEPPNARVPQPDGLDEIFLPRDVGMWDGGKGTVENAIRDDELGDWLAALRKKNAHVLLVKDACHSDSMMRVLPEGMEKTRAVKPGAALGLPLATLANAAAAAQARNAGLPGGPPDKNAAARISKQAGVMVCYAARDNEVTLERELPPRTTDARPHGLLTYTLCQVLLQATSTTTRPITYRELSRRIHAQYVAWGRTFPTPQMEGDEAGREVLGDKEWSGQAPIQLRKAGGALKINAGALHGLTRGTILQVLPARGQGNKVLGHIVIKEVRTRDCDVATCDAEGKPRAIAELPEDGICKIVFVGYDEQLLRLSVDGAVPAAERKALLKELAEMPVAKTVVQVVEKASEADWIVRPEKDGVLLLPAVGLSGDSGSKNPPFRGPAGNKPLLTWLSKQLSRITRAENLKKLAASTVRPGELSPRLEINIRRCANRADKNGTYPVAWPSNVTFFNGDLVSFEVTNTGRVAVDLTLLYVNKEYDISTVFPSQRRESNRLFPGEKQRIGPVRVVPPMPGLEHLVMLGVSGRGEAVDFRWLEDTEPIRMVGKPGNPFSMAVSDRDGISLQLLSWQVKAEKRPASKEKE